MRLIRLRVRNIASLRGEHDIDFEEIHKESSLFAITGETGSGKSTILNCISLALYGNVYKSNVYQPDVVTLGEKEGTIELIFQVKGEYYLADWKIRVLKQNGEPYATAPTATRLLYKIEGKDFSSTKSIAGTTAQDLLNLDFAQFCKCIILNQGEFAKFLTSSFSDRKDILEKLYPGEVLDNISKELDQERKSLEKLKNDTEIELHTLRGDNQSGDALKEEKIILETRLKELEKSQKHFEKLDHHFVSLFHYYSRFHENEKRKSVLENEIAAETTKFNEFLKNGTLLFERHESLKKRQETEIPILQTYLEKESTLRLLEEGWIKVKKDLTILSENQAALETKIQDKKSLEKELLNKCQNLSMDFKLPLNDLKASRENFQELFDLFSEKELLEQETKGIAERLSQLEVAGKDLKLELEKIEFSIGKLPPNALELETIIKNRKSDLQHKTDEKQRAEIKFQELTSQIEALKKEIKEHEEQSSGLKILISKTQTEIAPLEVTLKLQDVLNATEVCLEHAIKNSSDTCPICESPVKESRWSEIKQKLKRTDLEAIRKKFEEGTKLIFRSIQEDELHLSKISEARKNLLLKEASLKELSNLISIVLPPLGELDIELDKIRDEARELTQLMKERESKTLELNRIRQQYKNLREDFFGKESILREKTEKLLTFSGIHIPEINKDSIRDLKHEVKLLNTYIEIENELQRVTQEIKFLTDKKVDTTADLNRLSQTENEQTLKIGKLKSELEKALNGEKASDLIMKINALSKAASEEWQRHYEVQRKQELTIKDAQGRMYGLLDFAKESDMQFTKELHAVREAGHYEGLRNESLELLQKFKVLDLSFQSPKEIFMGLEEVIRENLIFYKTNCNECRLQLGSTLTKLNAWEKLQDRLQLLEIKLKDIASSLDRKLRLFEVIGRDEMRTFVLSLVEENLILQTNKELEKLCQGRYEIVHQTKSMKMVPEFFILDKFREGGRRKVSTLSGGETFMVSIAMALGLAEMTRGQAEIDSLFIDEGFGTLDQDSLVDVVDMLQQIQTRGLMVGIISHIKPLTEALPVNLVLHKRADGTSTISIKYN